MIITQTPLRISFAGGGTDLPEVFSEIGRGIVVSTAVDKFIFVLVNRRQDNLIKISYSKIEVVSDVNEIEHNIIRECLKLFKIKNGLDITYSADLPINTTGSGLGSSSALVVGVMLALATFVGDKTYSNPKKLAESAFRFESEILKHPVGKQDHYSAAFGGLNKFIFSNDLTECTKIQVNKKCLQDLNENLHLFYTGIDRISSSILESQKTQAPLSKNHYVNLNNLAIELSNDLDKNIVTNLGQVLTKGWNIKKNLAHGISNSKIDTWLQKAAIAGAQGGKICGAGGGGFLLLYIQAEKVKSVRNALSDLMYEQVTFNPFGSRVIEVFQSE